MKLVFIFLFAALAAIAGTVIAAPRPTNQLPAYELTPAAPPASSTRPHTTPLGPPPPPLRSTRHYDYERREHDHSHTSTIIGVAINANSAAAREAESTANKLAVMRNAESYSGDIEYFRELARRHKNEVQYLLPKQRRHEEAASSGGSTAMTRKQRRKDYKEAERSRDRAKATSSEARTIHAFRVLGSTKPTRTLKKAWGHPSALSCHCKIS